MPLDFLWGDEDYLIEKAINKIKKDVLADNINALNYKSIDNPTFALFSELLRTNSMMFGASIIVIKCAKYFFESKNKEKLDDKQIQELINALKTIPDSVHIVLVCETPRGEKKKPDSRKKLFKEVQKIAKIQEFQSFRNYEEYKIIPILKNIADELELKLNQSEASFLIQTAGSSLRDLSSILEKIKLYIYPQKSVTIEAIKETTSNKCDIFNLIDLILKKKWDFALDLINEILQKEHFLPTLAFLQSTLSNLLKIKLYSKNMSSYDLAVKLAQNEYVVKMNIEKVKNVDLNELIRLKINLEDMEFRLKTGALKEALLGFELAFLEAGL